MRICSYWYLFFYINSLYSCLKHFFLLPIIKFSPVLFTWKISRQYPWSYKLYLYDNRWNRSICFKCSFYVFYVFRCKFWNCIDIPTNEENICCKPQSIPASLNIRVLREIVLISLCLRPHFMRCYRLMGQ